MIDPFLEKQWHLLNERLQRCGSHIAGTDPSLTSQFAEQAAAFADRELPARYPIFLDRTREAAELAVQWQQQAAARASHPNASGTEQMDLASSTPAETSSPG